MLPHRRPAAISGVLAALFIPGLLAPEAPALIAEASTVSVDRARLMADVRWLADQQLEGRRAGTAGGIKARQWIADEFAAIGLTPAGSDGFFQPFSSSGRGVSEPDAANVVGRRGGTAPDARVLVVSAHYDHLGSVKGKVYPGADDNASGVAVLLAVARHLASAAPRHSVYFAALDAEEQGLVGAKAFLEKPLVPPDRIALNINLDMVSRSTRRVLYASGTSHSRWLVPILDPVRRRSKVTVRYGHDRPEQGPDDWTDQSDHGAFFARKVPYVYFGVENHADYHQPTDTADRIDAAFFGDAADTIVDAVVTLDREVP
jgi:hypothetical protein